MSHDDYQPSVETDDSNLPDSLLAAMRQEKGQWTPNCPPPTALLDLIEQGGGGQAAQRVLTHLASCTYCQSELEKMYQNLREAAQIRDSYPKQEPPITVHLQPSRQLPKISKPLRLAPVFGGILMAASVIIGLFISSIYNFARLNERQNQQIARQSEEIKMLQKQNTEIAGLTTQWQTAQQEAKQEREEKNRLKAKYDAVAASTKQTRSITFQIDPQKWNELQGTTTASGTADAPNSITVLFPASGAFTTDPQPTLKWKSVAGATKYNVTLYNFSRPEQPRFSSGLLSQTQWRVPKPLLSEDVYEWSVTAQNGLKPIATSSPTRFYLLPAPR